MSLTVDTCFDLTNEQLFYNLIAYIKKEVERSVSKKLVSLHYRYFKRLKRCNKVETHLSAGRNRIVYIFDTYVVKVPICGDGIADNDWEGSLSNGSTLNDPLHVQYARTRLCYSTNFDIPILFMERVDYIENFSYSELPDWVGSVDCGQVGYNKKGKLVAYDYGIR